MQLPQIPPDQKIPKNYIKATRRDNENKKITRTLKAIDYHRRLIKRLLFSADHARLDSKIRQKRQTTKIAGLTH